MQQMDQTHGKSISLSLSGGTIMQFRVVNGPKQSKQHITQASKEACELRWDSNQILAILHSILHILAVAQIRQRKT